MRSPLSGRGARRLGVLATLSLSALLIVGQTAAAQAQALQPSATSTLSTPVLAAPDAPVATTSADVRLAGPMLETTRAGAAPVLDATAMTPEEAARYRRASVSDHQSKVLMIVGSVAVVLGIFVDGGASDALVLGGAVIGLTGLYFYLH